MADAIEVFLARYSPEVQAISRELREVTRRAMPQAREVLYAKQNHFAYLLSESLHDCICYICPMKDYVRLGFMFGTHLADPERLLVGEGKRLRHVKVRTIEEARRPALERLVAAAWADAQVSLSKIQRR